MKIVAWVPIKLNNERLPGKNIKYLGGRPLCAYMLNTLLAVEGIDEVYVYCSDEMINEYLPAGVKFLQRTPVLDRTETTLHEIATAFLSEINADIYVNAHVTNPFLKAATIRAGLDKVKSGEYDSAHTVLPIQTHFWYKNAPLNFNSIDVSRTQNIDTLYMETHLYIYRKEVFTVNNAFHSINPYFITVNQFEAIDIDYAEDFLMAEAVYDTVIKDNFKGCSNVK